MSDHVAEIFGYLVLLIAVTLGVWESIAIKSNDSESQWLRTPARYRRRMMMASILICVAVMILLQAWGILLLTRPRDLILYVTLLSGFAIALFILSIRDLGDMARNAERHAVDELKSALEKEQSGKQENLD